MTTRIYRVTNTPAAAQSTTVRLVEARNVAQAVAHVVRDSITCEVASQTQLVESVKAGVEVERA